MMSSRPSLPLLLLVALLASPARADAPPKRYQIQDSVVYDTRTKLTWQRATAVDQYGTLATASSYCSSLDLHGTGFRVPTLRELATIVDSSRAKPAVDLVAFPDTTNEIYWTSTTLRDPAHPTNPPTHWGMFFDYGTTRVINGDGGLGDDMYVRCVR